MGVENDNGSGKRLECKNGSRCKTREQQCPVVMGKVLKEQNASSSKRGEILLDLKQSAWQGLGKFLQHLSEIWEQMSLGWPQWEKAADRMKTH